MRCLLLTLALALVGCAGTRPEAGLPPQYAAAPAAPTADPARSDLDVLPTGDHRLDRFLTDVAGAFERHDWRALAHTLDPDAYAEQFAFMQEGGRSAEAAVSQILEETFDLGTVGNAVYPDGLRRDERPFAGLDRIRVVMLDAVDHREGAITVEGRVRLDDRTSRRLTFQIIDVGGAYRVVVPMG